jgi:UDP-glucose 4-epimerase
MQTVLVTGGAGYVGSHACMLLAEAGYLPVVYDNLTNGHAEFVQWGPLERGDIRDPERLAAAFKKHRPSAVLHFAALIEVAESVRDPGRFYDNNVGGAICLIEAARRAGVAHFVFSSTAAVYGAVETSLISEAHPKAPVNPYGRSKLMVEEVLRDLDRHAGFRSVCLRYFNAAGADGLARIGERHEPETHLIPLAIRAAMDPDRPFQVFGQDYDTPDGTAVRDYVHVLDLAEAHVLALKRLLGGGASEVYNLGGGRGASVREVVGAVSRCAGRELKPTYSPRRDGDPPTLVACNRRAREHLGWRPRRRLDEIIATAWNWHAAEAVRAAKLATPTAS